MRYSRFDVDVAHPLQDLPLAPGDAGVAVLVRRKGVPIGYWMEATHGATSVSAAALEQRIASELGVRIVAEAVREELTPPRQAQAIPSLTIAICTKDRPDGVERLLDSLRAQLDAATAAGHPIEVLVVDNAPSDNRTRDLAARWPHVRYVLEPKPGLNFGRNRAIREASGEFLAYLDDDVVVDEGWLAGLCEAWAANPDAGAFTGQVLPMELETDAQIIFERRGGFRRGFDRVRYGPVSVDRLYPGGAGNFGAGANMCYRTRMLAALGGFDEALDTGAWVPGGGDLDMFYRVIRAGHPLVYEPRFLVFHQHRREMDALSRQYRRSWGLGFMCYLVKCLKTDPERRVNLLRLVKWWFVHHTRDLLGNMRRQWRGLDCIPPSMLAGELWGGVVGLCGGYGRSARRVAEIRRQFP
jgi:glycosyltransferase involved in cell wall biosynthesis